MTRVLGIRAAGWALLVLSFFLPFTRDWILAATVPSQYAFQNSYWFLVFGAPFLYPLLILGMLVIFRLVPEEHQRVTLAGSCYLLHFVFLTILIFTWAGEIMLSWDFDRTELITWTMFLLLWAAMGLDVTRLSRSLMLGRLLIQLSLGSLIWIERMAWDAHAAIGAQLAALAGAAASLTFLPTRHGSVHVPRHPSHVP